MNYSVIEQSQDLISAVLAEIDTTKHDLSSNLIVFPGKRPSYFLLDAISRFKKTAFIPPVVLSIEEFIDYCYENELGIVDKKIDTLSCCKLLKDLTVKGLKNSALQDLNAFIALALKIYRVCEELMIEGISPDRLMLDDVLIDEKLTKAQIQRLSGIHKAFYKELTRQIYSTRSLRYKKVSEGEIKIEAFTKVIFAGFFATTKSEKLIFKRFEKDQRVKFIYQDETSRSFSAESKYTPPPISIEKITLYECPDSHSQIFKLAEILKKDYETKKDAETFAIIAPSPDIIMPLINIIDRDFDSYNISIGYPLIKTPLYSFIKCLFDVLISMDNDRVYIPDYLNFVLHPYTKNITINNNAEITRTAFHSIQDELSKNRFKNYIALKDIECLKALKDLGDESVIGHIKSIHSNTIKAFKDIGSINDLSGRVKKLIDYIYTQSTAKRHILFFPYCEYMLDVLTELRHSLIAGERFKTPQGYFDFFKRFISLYNVPFKGTPIKDIQVLGFLEARNLSFDNLYILDVNEDILPNTDREDTIMPYDVRVRLGLPTYKDKERLFDYYLKTAINSSKRAVLFYVEDSQRQRSRFIEQIIWQVQKSEKDTDKRPFTPLSYSFTLKPYRPKGIPKDDAVREYLKKDMSYSASSVDTYYQCPLMFYYRYVLLPSEDEGVYEELQGKDVGIIVHGILRRYFMDRDTRFIEQKFNQELNHTFTNSFGEALRGETLIVKYQIQKRLAEFISQYSVITKSTNIEILELEKEFKTTIEIDLNDRNYDASRSSLWKQESKGKAQDFHLKGNNQLTQINLRGKVDRLERRDHSEIFIIDYKTSSDSSRYKAMWDRFDIDNRTTWKDAIKSIQMIFYMHLLNTDRHCVDKPTNASIMLVRERDVNRAELRLFEDNTSTYKTHIPGIINTLIREIITLPKFEPTDDLKNCDRCDYKDICWR